MLQNGNNGRILVIKHGALGDIVQAIDGFASLRAGNPCAYRAYDKPRVFIAGQNDALV